MRCLLLLIFIGFARIGVGQVTACDSCHVLDGYPLDSTVFDFSTGDSLVHVYPDYYAGQVVVDTANSGIWQIGTSQKLAFYSGLYGIRGIMTDTAQPYPVNANDFFRLLVFHYGFNTIISFHHRFLTTAGADGGVVEFSQDNGNTWENILGDCNGDDGSSGDLYTDSFYKKTDTLWNGEPGFTGNSFGWRLSRFQLGQVFPLRPAGGSSCLFSNQPIIIRFRFVSDAIPDSLAGWLIGDIKVENDGYSGSVQAVAAPSLQISPNPSTGLFYFPALPGAAAYSISVQDAFGKTILAGPYRLLMDMSTVPPGFYFYRVSDGKNFYQGRLVKE